VACGAGGRRGVRLPWGQRQGRRAEAYELLALIDDWFTAVSNPADLQEAKALLEALGA